MEPPEHFCEYFRHFQSERFSDGNIWWDENLAQHVDGCGHLLLWDPLIPASCKFFNWVFQFFISILYFYCHLQTYLNWFPNISKLVQYVMRKSYFCCFVAARRPCHGRVPWKFTLEKFFSNNMASSVFRPTEGYHHWESKERWHCLQIGLTPSFCLQHHSRWSMFSPNLSIWHRVDI